MIKGFKQFILRGNVIDLAIGVVVGGAFGTVVSSLVKDFITPLLGIISAVPNFSDKMFTINSSQFMYGDFINNLISFLLIATVLYFFVVLPVNTLMSRMHREPPAVPTNKKCPECLSEIPLEARRCAFCTSILAHPSSTV